MVGILNTILIAFLGCVLATILGVIAGVLRLSKNWLVAKLMAVYVEGFRNVPLLLWILLIFALMTESMPAPRDFRGDDPAASMLLFDTVAVTNRGVYIPAVHLANPLTGSGFVNWLIILASSSPHRSSAVNRVAPGPPPGRRRPACGRRPGTSSLVFSFVPTALVLLLMGAYLNYPQLSGFNFSDGIHLRNSLIALWLRAVALYRRLHRRERARRHPCRLARARPKPPMRWACARDHDEPGDPAAGAAGHHPAADLAVSQPHQELVAGHRGGLHGRAVDAGGHHASTRPGASLRACCC
jgi:ABC-type amino acid transport system permease subunit